MTTQIPAAGVAIATGAPAAGQARGRPVPDSDDPVTSCVTDRPRGHLQFVAYGRPAPQGSKRHVGGGRMVEQSRHVKPWREAVKSAALDAMDGRPLRLDGPLWLAVRFFVRDRPVSKPTWWPAGVKWSRRLCTQAASMPDLSKLIRATEDALTDAGVWTDDARVVQVIASKRYCAEPEDLDGGLPAPGAQIIVQRLPLEVAP